MSELYTLTIDGVSQDLHVIRFHGREALSELFRFEIDVASSDANIAPSSVIGRPGLLTMQIGDEPRHVHGMVLSFELTTSGKQQHYYRAVVVPDAWKAAHNQNLRIFQEMNAADIIDAVLGATSHRMALSGSYATRTYCVQYRESDWRFVSRLMEEEGMYAYFSHTSGGHELVVADSPSAAGAIAGDTSLRFRPAAGALAAGEHVSVFSYREAVRPDKVALTDYNFTNPSLELATSAGGGDVEVYDYPGNYGDPGTGGGLAGARLEALAAAGRVGAGKSGCVRFMPGHTFSLTEHGSDSVNRGYALVSVVHRGQQPDSAQGDDGSVENYVNEFECIPDDVPYRTPRRTPKPTINGVQTAVVTGPSGEEIYTDEHGRVKVHFHWDRLGATDETSSCWLRVGQIWAGAGWGALYIPRIGHEVIVSFIEGDPDRPIITGSVYHGSNAPPYVLPAEKTKSTLRSSTTKGGGGNNELMFDDSAGAELVYMHAQKDLSVGIENDKNQTVGGNESLEVTGDRDKSIAGSETETVGGSKTITVSGAHTETIALVENITVGLAASHNIGGAFMENVGAAKSSNVAGVLTEIVGVSMNLTVGTNKDESIGANATESVGATKTVAVTGNYDLDVGGDLAAVVKGNRGDTVDGTHTHSVKESYALDVGSGKITVDKDGTITVEGKNITIKGSGTIQVEGKKLQVESKGTVDLKASGAIKVKGKSVDVN